MKLKGVKTYLGRRQKTMKLVLHYAKYFSFKQPKTKQIVVCFDGLVPHGGLVDRLKGIISCYQIANELGYDFKILFDNPFKLTDFLEPNTMDWTCKRSEIIWHPLKTKLLYLVNDFDANPLHRIKTSKANRFYVYANIDYSKTIFPNLNAKEREEGWRNSFNALFKKSIFLDKKLNEITTSKFIAFHTRFTSLMGDFKDTTSRILSDEAQEKLTEKLLQIVNRIKAEEREKAFLFSDSIKFLDAMKTRTDIAVIEGNPFHMDNFDKSEVIEGHLKTMIDFFVISKSENVYFLMVEPMYNSSFSKYAAIIGDTNFECVEA